MSEINAESTTMPPVELRMPRASEREEMLAGKLYNSVDPELNALREKAGDLCARFNAASRTDHAARAAILDELLPGHGAGLDVMGPIFFDYGCNITIGERVFANFNFTVLDCCPVTNGLITRAMVPPHTVAVGNPARPIREITDADASALQYYAQ